MSARVLLAIAMILATTSTQHAGELEGSVGVQVSADGNEFRSPGEASYKINGFIDYNAGLTGSHDVEQTVPWTNFIHPVVSDGDYNFVAEGPAEPETCYSASLTIEADGSDHFVNQNDSWTAGPACTTTRYESPRPPPPSEYELDNSEIRSPILLDLDRNGFHLAGTNDAVWFDIDADGVKDRISWTAAGTADTFLALDRNGNGTIDTGAELFGNATFLHDGTRASNGYVALAEFDRNADGAIGPDDSVWTSLLLWTDRNHNGVSDRGEVTPVQNAVASIRLNFIEERRRDRHGNAFRYASRATLRNSDARVVATQTYDVFFVRAN